jgi:hypothetical protein
MVRGLDRAKAPTILKKEIFNDYSTLYKSLQEQYGIPAQDIYNMDEKAFAMGTVQRTQVLIPMKERDAYLHQDGSCEWVSIIKAISGGGDSLPSWIIFHGVY